MKSYKASIILCGIAILAIIAILLYMDKLENYVDSIDKDEETSHEEEPPSYLGQSEFFSPKSTEKPVRARAIGSQFFWIFHYPGKDGKFGFIDYSKITKDNVAGLTFTDAHAQDDFLSNELITPVNIPLILQVTSTDVIHNFSIIPMRIQQDGIPGKDIPMWFTPIAMMDTEVVCGQLCGQGHPNMKSRMKVVSKEEYEKWFHSQTPLSQQSNKSR